MSEPWYRIADASSIPTPTLLFYPDRIRANTAQAVRIAGRPARLRPHVKTHKCPGVVALMIEAGIARFKCATLAEAAMLAAAGATDVVIAYPLVGPNPALLCRLCARYPAVSFKATVDSRHGIEALGAAAAAAGLEIETLLDLDVGMHRTGVAPGPEAIDLYRCIARNRHLTPGGLHAYDGHTHDADPAARRAAVAPIVAAVHALADELRTEGLAVPRIVAGGTPSLPCHAELAPEFELSPGTCFLHDWGYQERYPDLPFEPAALLLGRVVSARTGPHGNVTIDIGSKAIATDPSGARGRILDLPDAEPVGQSEEHWVFRASGGIPRIGEEVYVLPRHICPTVALHAAALVLESGSVTGRWPIAARDREVVV